MNDDDDDLDRSALLARRDLLLRRALLAGATGIAAGAAACSPPRPCLSEAIPQRCGGKEDAPLPAGGTWQRRDNLGGVATDKGPLFGSDKPIEGSRAGTEGHFTFDANASGINDLNAAGVAAFEELVPTLAGATVEIHVAIVADAPGPAVDANARALGIQAFLATKGVQADARGEGTCASGTFQMSVQIVACVEPAPPATPSAATSG